MKKLIVAAILAGALPAPALAQNASQVNLSDRQDSHTAMYKALDRDGDGKISREEFLADAVTRYQQFLSQLDANKDGIVSREEFLGGRQPGR